MASDVTITCYTLINSLIQKITGTTRKSIPVKSMDMYEAGTDVFEMSKYS
jgi:hypothetical protein